MEVYPDVHLVEEVRGSNCYLICGPELILIDTGLPGQVRQILDYISGLGRSVGELHWIVLTHHDIDHIGNAAELQRLIGAEVCMHPADVDYVQGKVRRRPFWKAWLCDLTIALRKLQPPEINRLVHDGETIGPLEVIHTPGHSAGSISLKYGSVLFVGDLVRGGRFPRENFFLTNEDNNLARASIKKLAQLDFEVLCPGHGRPISRAAERLRHLASRWAR